MSDSGSTFFLPISRRDMHNTGPQFRGELTDMCSISPSLSSSYAFRDSPRLCFDATPSVLLYPSATTNDRSNPHTTSSLWDALGNMRSPTADERSDSMVPWQLSLEATTARPLMFEADYGSMGTQILLETSQPYSWLTPLPEGEVTSNHMAGNISEQHNDVPAQGDASSPDCFLEEQGMTLMLRNLPSKLTRDMLLGEFHERGLLNDINFLYLPIDLRHERNVGYCFVNLTSEDACRRFRQAFGGVKLSQIEDAGKVCAIDLGKLQGLAANIAAYRNAAVMSMSDRYRPLLLLEGKVVPFPKPILSRTQELGAPRGSVQTKWARGSTQSNRRRRVTSSTKESKESQGASAKKLRTTKYRRGESGESAFSYIM